MMMVNNVIFEDHAELLEVWENSVRATHNFLSEAHIEFFKPFVSQALPAITLKCIKNEHHSILGFIGVHATKVEMLFVLKAARGQGVGKALLQYAIDHLQINKVDVNEQNPLAVGFYQNMGFKVIARSLHDDMGKPFPILHMVL